MPRLAIPLSDLQCRTAKTRERAYKLFDGGGMYLFVKPNGVKTWRLKYTKPSGKEGTLIIGNYPIVTLSVARRKRDEAKALLLDNLDPMEEKKKAKIVAQRAALLFETVALEWHADMSRRWTEGHAKTVMSRLRTHVFPLIGQRPIAELDTHDLLEITQRIKERGTMDVALRVQNYLSTIMRGAKRARQITMNPALDLAGSIHAPRTIHRPALSLNRLPELLHRIDNYNGRELTRLAVLLTLHVFVRSSELRFARWSEFDFQRAMWEIPDTRAPIEGVRNSTRGTKMNGDIQMVRAVGVSGTTPNSGAAPRWTSAPQARARSWPPRQMPSTGLRGGGVGAGEVEQGREMAAASHRRRRSWRRPGSGGRHGRRHRRADRRRAGRPAW